VGALVERRLGPRPAVRSATPLTVAPQDVRQCGRGASPRTRRAGRAARRPTAGPRRRRCDGSSRYCRRPSCGSDHAWLPFVLKCNRNSPGPQVTAICRFAGTAREHPLPSLSRAGSQGVFPATSTRKKSEPCRQGSEHIFTNGANAAARQRDTCALSAAISASLRNVIAPIWLSR
jgi:hypothetical protein